MILRTISQNKTLYDDNQNAIGVRIKVCYKNTENQKCCCVTKDIIDELINSNPELFNDKIKDYITYYGLNKEAIKGVVDV